ncbi:MAG: cyanophycin synthetase, partial [Planctomycetota bacterium]|nr:cyanophycin synthetase [Planctomycetota bacterium]
LEVEGKRVLVIAAPGDRRDEDIVDIATACAGHYDHYICRRDDNTRGRDGGEVPRLQAEALMAAGVPSEQIEQIPDEQEAIDRGLSVCGAGDLLLVFGDAIERSWRQIVDFDDDGEALTKPAVKKASADGLVQIDLVPQVHIDGTDELIRDGRGVRLARSVELED